MAASSRKSGSTSEAQVVVTGPILGARPGRSRYAFVDSFRARRARISPLRSERVVGWGAPSAASGSRLGGPTSLARTRAAPTKSRKSGAGRVGRDLNSGWNWLATNQG